MTFAEAVTVLRDGDRVCREGWGETRESLYQHAGAVQRQALGEDGRVASVGLWSPCMADFDADDWAVLPLRQAH